MVKNFYFSKIVEIEYLEALHRVEARLTAQWTENVTVVIRQQLMEDVDAQIAGGTSQEHIADGLLQIQVKIYKSYC